MHPPAADTLGFVTGTITTSFNQICYKVYVPASPNPAPGYLVFYPEHAVKPAEMSVETALQNIISGVIVGPEKMGL